MTAVLAGKHQHIRETYESLAGQKMPPGWDWQWVVQEDGETGTPLAGLPDDRRISPGVSPHGRAARARTIALSRVKGVLVRALDADDILTELALYRDITTLTEHPGIGWCVSPALDLLEDGSVRRGPRDPAPGPLPSGFLADGERAGLLQVLGNTMCAYTELVRALGGWPALPSEDVGLLLAAEAVSDGWMIAEPGLLYRRWPGSNTAHINKWSASAGSPHRTVILDRVDAIRAAGWRWAPSATAFSDVPA